LSAYYLDWGTKTYDLVVDPTLSPWKARKPPRSWRDGQEMLSLKSCLVLAHAGVARLTAEGAAVTGRQYCAEWGTSKGVGRGKDSPPATARAAIRRDLNANIVMVVWLVKCGKTSRVVVVIDE
jgi:hypothetical protein